MNRIVVGLLGLKGSGKDTCAKYLVEEKGFIRIGFADALYREVAQAFDVTVEFLGNRETKETDLPSLALVHCSDAAFIRTVREEEGALAEPDYQKFLHKPRSPRYLLQLWGTEYRRRRGVDGYWLDIVKAAIDAQPDKCFVVTDVRFSNEANFIEELNGVLVRVRRLVLEAKEASEREQNGRAAHPSETELLARAVPYELFNLEGEPHALRQGIFNVLSSQVSAAAFA